MATQKVQWAEEDTKDRLIRRARELGWTVAEDSTVRTVLTSYRGVLTVEYFLRGGLGERLGHTVTHNIKFEANNVKLSSFALGETAALLVELKA